ncbi:hypothetical protein SK128_008615, partial [Halocaridina rubra]
AWLKVLSEFSNHYQRHWQAVRALAALDVLIALAIGAKAQGYCRPKIHEIDENTNNGLLRIIGGRHPVISQMKMGDEQYVANNTNLQVTSKCTNHNLPGYVTLLLRTP